MNFIDALAALAHAIQRVVRRVRASDGAQQVSVTLLYKVDPLDGQKPFWAPWSACCAPIPDPDALALISNRVVKAEDYTQAMRRFAQHQTHRPCI